MNNDKNLENKYVEKIVSMGYTEENARDYIESQKPKTTEVDPNLGINNVEELEIKLPEVNESVFASSSNILLQTQGGVNPYARGLAVLLLIGCIAGFVNGIDYLSPTSGLIKPHDLICEFQYNFLQICIFFNIFIYIIIFSAGRYAATRTVSKKVRKVYKILNPANK